MYDPNRNAYGSYSAYRQADDAYNQAQFTQQQITYEQQRNAADAWSRTAASSSSSSSDDLPCAYISSGSYQSYGYKGTPLTVNEILRCIGASALVLGGSTVVYAICLIVYFSLPYPLYISACKFNMRSQIAMFPDYYTDLAIARKCVEEQAEFFELVGLE